MAFPSRLGSLQHTLRFPRRNRLKSPLTIRNVSRDGGRLSGDGFSVHWSPAQSEQPARSAGCEPRLAFVVSRHCGPAHQRNRIKRRLREAVRVNRAIWPQPPGGLDIVFRAKGAAAASRDFEELRRDIVNTLTRMDRTQN